MAIPSGPEAGISDEDEAGISDDDDGDIEAGDDDVSASDMWR